MTTQKICFAGFGGQGVLSVGRLLAYAAMMAGKEVSWCPSYGPEMRGGTANCAVVISDEPIGAPIITKDATSAIVMNEPSLHKFQDLIIPGGSLIINGDLVTSDVERKDIRVITVPANTIAKELGNPKLANIVLLGALMAVQEPVPEEMVFSAFPKVFGANKAKFIPINHAAMDRGKIYGDV
ncbi:2-oxoacid:acceptor oxidoreductase family protein [Eubacterium barkeri]|uniref:2-oxoglutarate ferredoxin oxidoreductase subunit gamma n=1 Tax=Eubacterium barkeri TaxID=1528 RepID=A0A1H3GID4_EUBBA|nr:2-oxoacid:acceptor oxidoreductase family protein [Eubacterium barkeri]SDY03051.1 2-oxoglutarate ferredoxin oxidoreductase subunit gamma [Eubacterium barkeri]